MQHLFKLEEICKECLQNEKVLSTLDFIVVFKKNTTKQASDLVHTKMLWLTNV